MSIYSLFDSEIRVEIENINELPTLPHISQQLLELRENANAGSNELAHILEFDPILGAQIVRYASTPVFCSRKATNLLDAINRLGYDKALIIALGLATGRHFVAPLSGPLGLKSFWRHAVFSATLMQRLVEAIQTDESYEPGMVYLCGLLHNIGYLLFAHQFPNEHKTLNKMVQQHPEKSSLEIEKICTGASHNEIGLWLVRKWNLPAPLMTTIYEHHNANYRGEHSIYPNLALIADRALKQYDIGDAETDGQDEEMLDRLQLSHNRLEAIVDQLMGETADIESFIQTLLS